MPMLEFQGQTLDVNEDGFLLHPENWSEALAEHLAHESEHLEQLTPEHWLVIRTIRAYYLEKDMAPMVRFICKSTGLPLRQIYDLFPSGPAKGACKLAGLPKPDGCV